MCNLFVSRVFVPQRNDHVCVDRSGHSPLIPRSHFPMLFLPDEIPGLPMARYFENAVLFLIARTRTPLPSLSNRSLSPIRTPSTRRTSRGTVIRPLLVMVACFCILTPSPYFITASLPPIGPTRYSGRSKLCKNNDNLGHRELTSKRTEECQSTTRTRRLLQSAIISPRISIVPPLRNGRA